MPKLNKNFTYKNYCVTPTADLKDGYEVACDLDTCGYPWVAIGKKYDDSGNGIIINFEEGEEQKAINLANALFENQGTVEIV